MRIEVEAREHRMCSALLWYWDSAGGLALDIDIVRRVLAFVFARCSRSRDMMIRDLHWSLGSAGWGGLYDPIGIR